MKILIVDDEKLDLFIAKKLLNMEFEAEGFSELPDVLNWASTNDFDLAIIDYYLTPPLLADQVLRDLINIKGNSFKAYVLTNYIDNDLATQLKENGFEGIINKPLTLEVFKALVS